MRNPAMNIVSQAALEGRGEDVGRCILLPLETHTAMRPVHDMFKLDCEIAHHSHCQQ
jgi:hypothetical protein